MAVLGKMENLHMYQQEDSPRGRGLLEASGMIDVTMCIEQQRVRTTAQLERTCWSGVKYRRVGNKRSGSVKNTHPSSLQEFVSRMP